MLFQMIFAHPSIAADGLLRSRRTGCTLLRKGLVLGRNPCQGVSLKRHENSVAGIVTGCFLFGRIIAVIQISPCGFKIGSQFGQQLIDVFQIKSNFAEQLRYVRDIFFI